jgi:hypothetical protein
MTLGFLFWFILFFIVGWKLCSSLSGGSSSGL